MSNYRKRKRTTVNPIAVFLICLSIVLIAVSAFSIFSAAQLSDKVDTLNSEISRASSEIEVYKQQNEHLNEVIYDQSSQIVSLQQMKASKNQSSATYTGPKVCYLTFDDGPSENTPRILEILKEKNAKATWFCIHTSYPQYMKNISDGGHTVAIHTYSHNYRQIYSSTDAYFNDLNKIKSEIKQYTGIDTKLCRFPGGSSNTTSKSYCKGVVTSIAKRMNSEGYIYFDWNVDSGDANGNNIAASKLVANIKRDVGSQRCINVLMHDTGSAKRTTVEALPDIIDYLRSQGYTFEALTTSSHVTHHAIAN